MLLPPERSKMSCLSPFSPFIVTLLPREAANSLGERGGREEGERERERGGERDIYISGEGDRQTQRQRQSK